MAKKKWLKLGLKFWAQISICVKKLTFRNSAQTVMKNESQSPARNCVKGSVHFSQTVMKKF